MEYWKNLHPDTRRNLIIALKCAGGASAAIGGAVIILPIAGFGAGGVASGSAAAAWQGCIGAAVQSGSWFATFQSAGAAGLAGTTKIGLGTMGVIAANLDNFYPKNDPGNLDRTPSPTQRSIDSISAICLHSVASTLKPPGTTSSANVAYAVTEVPSAAPSSKNDPDNLGLLSSSQLTKVTNAAIEVASTTTNYVGVAAFAAAEKSVNFAGKMFATAKSAINGVKDDDKQ